MIAKGLCRLLPLLLLACLAHGELLMTVWIARHGAREPKRACNEILQPGSKKFAGHRRLTNVGMRQQYILGRAFEAKYGEKFNISAATVAVRSTMYHRTFASGMSFLRGLKALGEQQPVLFVILSLRLDHMCPSEPVNPHSSCSSQCMISWEISGSLRSTTTTSALILSPSHTKAHFILEFMFSAKGPMKCSLQRLST